MKTELRNMVPMSKVVKASIIDVYGDLGRTQERFSHWAARGLRKLTRETLRIGKRRVLLPISRNTLSATLPPDCDGVTFVGIIDDEGKKIPLVQKSNLVYTAGVEEVEPDACDVCSQDKNICEQVYNSEEINLIEIDGEVYEEVVNKKMYPNGDYFEEKTTPVKDLETGLITSIPSSQFVTNFDIKECGCLDDSSDNLCKIREHCPDIYTSYYVSVDCSCAPLDFGGCSILEDEGLIIVEPQYPYDNIYVEYIGFIPKANGQYLVPQVAFEALVNFIKFKSVENKKGIPIGERDWYFRNYVRERDNMEKILYRVSLSQIIYAAGLTPKLSIYTGNDGWYKSYQNNINMNRCRSSRSTSKTCGENEPQVIQTVIKTQTTTNDLIYRKLKFSVGDSVITDDDGPVAYAQPLQEGDTVLFIGEAGIKKGSVNVVLNTQTLHENVIDQVGYGVVYGLNGATVTMNQEAESDQKYSITYTKAVTI